MHVRLIFVPFLILGLLGCSEDSPTAPEPTLDTTPRTANISWKISGRDGTNCVNSGQPISAEIGWRFISFRQYTDGVKVSGGYSITLKNPNDRYVEFTLESLSFLDALNIAITEDDILNEDMIVIPALGDNLMMGTFDVVVAQLEVTELITTLGFRAFIKCPQ